MPDARQHGQNFCKLKSLILCYPQSNPSVEKIGDYFALRTGNRTNGKPGFFVGDDAQTPEPTVKILEFGNLR